MTFEHDGALTVAVTGGIGAGKSTVSGLLAGHGAVLIDSDRIAREVVGAGTPGLAAVVGAFGPAVLTAGGHLDRAAVAGLVFADPAARSRLESIIHPLVRGEVGRRRAAAPVDAVVVNDIPILRDLTVAASYHLVVGVGAPDGARVRRLVDRGMTEQDAGARIAAQIGDDERRRLCDVWLDNAGGREELEDAVGALWSGRLLLFAENRRANRPADPVASRWATLAVTEDLVRLLAARIGVAARGPGVAVAPAARPAAGVIGFDLAAPTVAAADVLATRLAATGFPALRSAGPERLHASADPARPVELAIRLPESL